MFKRRRFFFFICNSAAIAASAAIQGISYDFTFNTLADHGVELTHDEEKQFIGNCNQFISSLDDKNLKRYEPDILGESLFLLFYKQFHRRSKRGKISPKKDIIGFFLKLLCYDEQQENQYLLPNERFIEFIQRTSRNLSNDNQDATAIKVSWEALFEFLSPQNFEDERIRLSANCALILMLSDILYLEIKIDEHYKKKLVSYVSLSDLGLYHKKYVSKNCEILTEQTFNWQLFIIYFSLQAMEIWLRTGKTLTKADKSVMEYFSRYLSLSYHSMIDQIGINELRNFEEFGVIIYYDLPNLLSWLVQHKGIPDINALNEMYPSMTVLDFASYFRAYGIVNKILNDCPKALPNFQFDLTWKSILVEAYFYDQKEIVDILLEQKLCNINHRDINGNTLLMHACKKEDLETVRSLYKNPFVKVSYANFYGQTAQDIAFKSGNKRIVEVFGYSGYQLELDFGGDLPCE